MEEENPPKNNNFSLPLEIKQDSQVNQPIADNLASGYVNIH